uniref:Plasmalemma vesicle associated protein n=1 Tax=Microcebus murinus TaxID=30608 RepID=A0A8C5Y0R3_MICMU
MRSLSTCKDEPGTVAERAGPDPLRGTPQRAAQYDTQRSRLTVPRPAHCRPLLAHTSALSEKHPPPWGDALRSSPLRPPGDPAWGWAVPGGLAAELCPCPPAGQAVDATNLRYVAAIILSEKQCQDRLQETNKSCNALLLMLGQKARTAEVELAKEKAVCGKDREGLALARRAAEEQLAECGRAREQQRQERQLAEDRLQKVQALCLQLDKDKFEADLRSLWRDSIIPRRLDSLSYGLYAPLGPELDAIRRGCDLLPGVMSSKVEELARSLRAGIERVARENSDLQRQKLEAEQGLRAGQEAREKAEKEAQAREAKLQAECARQTQLALEEKAALRRERDGAAKELQERKREAEQAKMQLAVSNSALDTCIKAKSQPLSVPRPVGPAPNPPPVIDAAGLEEFKRRILESQRPPAGSPAAPASG